MNQDIPKYFYGGEVQTIICGLLLFWFYRKLLNKRDNKLSNNMMRLLKYLPFVLIFTGIISIIWDYIIMN